MASGCKLITVIEEITVTGEGVDNDPIREVITYWSPEGKLLAVRDDWKPSSQEKYDSEVKVSDDLRKMADAYQQDAEQLQAQLAAYRAMMTHLADIVENCDQAGGALAVTVVREARELLSTPYPATDLWLAGVQAKALRDAANKMESKLYLSENYIVHADWLRGLAAALESRAGTQKLAPEK